ncbi:MAG: hypothetical protein KIT14_04620 [bacterium]|nr:hypothetical protein [bacterium]
MPRVVALLTVLAGLLSAATSGAANVPIAGGKLTVVSKGAAGKAKVVFVVKDAAVAKGPGRDPARIAATLDVAYDGAKGVFRMPQGAGWILNGPRVAKYVNKAAPEDGAVKSSLLKPGALLKIVAGSLGDTPLDVAAAPTGSVLVATTIVNDGEETRLCTRFTGCRHKVSPDGRQRKLVCTLGTGDPDCPAALQACPAAPPPAGGSYPGCTTSVPSGETCTLVCADGYTKLGVTDPACFDGSFTGADTSCEPATCAPLDLPAIASDCVTAPTGSECTVGCAPGAHRTDGGTGDTTTATCTGVGPGTSTWSFATFTCGPDPCPTAPPPPAGGSFPGCTTDVPSGTTCTLACAAGYTKTGTADPACTSGAFAGGDTTCVPATCAPLTLPLVVSNCGTAPTGSQCTLGCAPGAHRSDGGGGATTTATCAGVATGASAWSHATFTCEADPCPAVPPPPTGGAYPGCAAPVSSGQTCALACAAGYSKSGANDPICIFGAFTAIGETTCVPATCAPLNVAHVVSDCGTAPTGSTCAVQCAPGAVRTDGGGSTSVSATCSGVSAGASVWSHPTFTCAPED